MRRTLCLLTWAAVSGSVSAQEATPLQVVPLQRPGSAAASAKPADHATSADKPVRPTAPKADSREADKPVSSKPGGSEAAAPARAIPPSRAPAGSASVVPVHGDPAVGKPATAPMSGARPAAGPHAAEPAVATASRPVRQPGKPDNLRVTEASARPVTAVAPVRIATAPVRQELFPTEPPPPPPAAPAPEEKAASPASPKAAPRPVAPPRPRANPAGAGQTFSGSLSGSVSKVHHFNAKAGDKVRVELSGRNPLAYLTVTQPDGKEMLPTETRGLLANLPMDGQYSVKVFLFRDGAGSDGKPVDYRLRVVPVK